MNSLINCIPRIGHPSFQKGTMRASRSLSLLAISKSVRRTQGTAADPLMYPRVASQAGGTSRSVGKISYTIVVMSSLGRFGSRRFGARQERRLELRLTIASPEFGSWMRRCCIPQGMSSIREPAMRSPWRLDELKASQRDTSLSVSSVRSVANKISVSHKDCRSRVSWTTSPFLSGWLLQQACRLFLDRQLSSQYNDFGDLSGCGIFPSTVFSGVACCLGRRCKCA